MKRRRKGAGRPRLVNRPVMLSIRVEREVAKVLGERAKAMGEKLSALARNILTDSANGGS